MIGTVKATDADAGTTLSYSISSGNAMAGSRSTPARVRSA
ncbi:cadherin repeat domain-containing protein [Acinetobacter lwoffii]|nr:cadherin repeat domain-containing protein [Acinetobacter lwoffii]